GGGTVPAPARPAARKRAGSRRGRNGKAPGTAGVPGAFAAHALLDLTDRPHPEATAPFPAYFAAQAAHARTSFTIALPAPPGSSVSISLRLPLTIRKKRLARGRDG